MAVWDNSYAALPEAFYARQKAAEVPEPKLFQWNEALGAQLGLNDIQDKAEVFGGNVVPEGAAPLAQLYAGHQFGHFNPQLGDGRALLLGEVLADGARYDVQLKGSGQTPYSRNGDGRAALGPVLREYLVSEAMHAMGVPTTRALAIVTTGARVQREVGLPGAVLTRVAASHLRVGTFQVFAARQQYDHLQTLYEYAVDRHAPGAEDPLAFLTHVIDAQARLVAQWMSLGFIHGVMNTDNCTISGETIDYGPCAFMDTYHPNRVYSSIDHTGRYAYANQVRIIVWNMAQLATALVPLMSEEDAAIEAFTAAIHAMPVKIEREWRARFGAKIGLASPVAEDQALIEDFLTLMAEGHADFTNTFRALATDKARDQFLDPAAFDAWEARWSERVAGEADPHAVMARANPAVIPRNHLVEAAINAAYDGDRAPFDALHKVLSTPFETPDDAKYTRPPADAEVVRATFCGT
ncbi:protein adenylyltransferase SelO [Pseudaestuariivita sp.]|uniref:protein adenylyltransferase SelO n=1 Tax=Pseudaestuariivita sp. TaxID=2211669 RepID=UPI004059204A